MADYRTCRQCFVRVRVVPGATYLCSACKRPLPGLEANAPAEGASAPPAPGLARPAPAVAGAVPVQLVVEGVAPAPRRATVVAVQPPPEGAAPPKSSRRRADDENDDDKPGRKRERAKLPKQGGVGLKRILGAVLSLLVVGGLVVGKVWLKMKPDKALPAPAAFGPAANPAGADLALGAEAARERDARGLVWVARDYPKLGARAEFPGHVTEWPNPIRLFGRLVPCSTATSDPIAFLTFELVAIPKDKAPRALPEVAAAIAAERLHGAQAEAQTEPRNRDLGFEALRVVRDDHFSGKSTVYGWSSDAAYHFVVVSEGGNRSGPESPTVRRLTERFLKSIKRLNAASPPADATAMAPGAGDPDPFTPAPSAPASPGTGEANPFTPVPPKLPKRPAPPTSPPTKSPRPTPAARKSAFAEAGSVAKHLAALDTGRDTDFLTVEAGSKPGEFRVMRYSLPKCQLIGAQNFDGDIAEAVFDPEYQRLFVATTSTPLVAPGLPRSLAGTGTVRMYSLKELLGLDRESRGEALKKGAASAEAPLTNRHVRGLKLGTDGEWVVAIAQAPSGEGKSAKAVGPQVLKLDAKTLAVKGQIGYAKTLLTVAVNPTTGDVAVVPHPFNPFGALALGTPDPDATLELIDGAKWAKKRSVRLDFNPAGAAYSAKGALVVSGVRGTRGVLVGINVKGADEVTNYSKSDDRGPVPYGEVQMRPDESELAISPHEGRVAGYLPPGVSDRPDLPRRFVAAPASHLSLVADGKFLVSAAGAVFDLAASNKAFAEKALAGGPAEEKAGGD